MIQRYNQNGSMGSNAFGFFAMKAFNEKWSSSLGCISPEY